MRRECSCQLFLKVLMVMALCVMSTHAAQAEVVNFPDKNLEAAVRKAINKPIGDILQTDLVRTRFTGLTASDADIENLEGLQYCADLTLVYLPNNQVVDLRALACLTKLETLLFGGNQIVDLRALAGLTNLKHLYLGSNQVTDVSALAGLTALKHLDLRGNQISDISALATNTGISYESLFHGGGVVHGGSNAIDMGNEFQIPDKVDLRDNPLNQHALCNVITTLKARGVDVVYDGECSGKGDG